MIELMDWIPGVSFPAKPWLILGKGPSFSRRTEFDLGQFNLLARMGVKTVRTLGLDGGRGYSLAFSDLEAKTHLAAGHSSFDSQFIEMRQIVQRHGMDYAPLIEPLRVFVGTDESSMMGTR